MIVGWALAQHVRIQHPCCAKTQPTEPPNDMMWYVKIRDKKT